MNFHPTDIQAKFKEIFHKEALIVRAPGRINLIGEHTDYNDGFVMPAAVDKEIFFGIAASDDRRSVFYSINYDERFEVDLHDPQPVTSPQWANFLLGVLFQFRENGFPVKPFYCAFGGNVPLGAGMSSSAAMECGFAFALSEFNLLNVPKLKIITMAQWAEHHFVGVKCGIMDQFASVMGKEGHAIVLDCRSLEHRYAPLDLKEYGIILCDTKVKHSLVNSEYNTRRKECESGVSILQQHYRQVKSLRDVSPDMLRQHRSEFPGRIYDRCLYVVQEIDRVQLASADLDKNDLEAFGRKMFETHEGLSSLYEVSCKELDFLVAEARKSDAVLGSRMMGGGFGGCTINLVRNDRADTFVSELQSKYRRAFSIDMVAYPVRVVDGVSSVREEDLALWT
jgi:galactokinase